MGDGVAFADVGEELVAEPLALRGAAHQAGDVDEGQAGRDDLLRAGDRGERFEPRIGHGDVADVGLDGAERIIGRLGRGGLGQRVEKRRLADVGQADDAAFETHGSALGLQGGEGSSGPMRGPTGKGKGRGAALFVVLDRGPRRGERHAQASQDGDRNVGLVAHREGTIDFADALDALEVLGVGRGRRRARSRPTRQSRAVPKGNSCCGR